MSLAQTYFTATMKEAKKKNKYKNICVCKNTFLQWDEMIADVGFGCFMAFVQNIEYYQHYF